MRLRSQKNCYALPILLLSISVLCQFVNKKAIKIEPTGGQLGNNSSSSRPNIDSIYSISDLFALVKKYDKEFHPKPVSKHLVRDGESIQLYHQTEK